MLETDGWSEDDLVGKDYPDMMAENLATRRGRAIGSKTMVFSGRLALSVMKGMDSRHLVPWIEVTIFLNRAPVNIMLMAEAPAPVGDAKTEIKHASMFVRRVIANTSVQVEHAKSWLVTSATYSFLRTKASFKSIAQGVTGANFLIQKHGQILNRLHVGLIHHQA